MTKDTHWFFMLPSTNEVEIRHIYDIAFGVRCLISKNIDYSDITILIDNSSYAKVTLCFSNMGIPIPKKSCFILGSAMQESSIKCHCLAI